MQIGEYIIEPTPIDFIWVVLFCACVLVGGWKMFEKAGKPGWAILVPIYNVWVEYEIAFGKGTYMFLMFIPFVNFVMLFLLAWKLSKAFGYGFGMFLVTSFFSPIAFMIFGFGKRPYVGVGGANIPQQQYNYQQPYPTNQVRQQQPVQQTNNWNGFDENGFQSREFGSQNFINQPEQPQFQQPQYQQPQAQQPQYQQPQVSQPFPQQQQMPINQPIQQPIQGDANYVTQMQMTDDGNNIVQAINMQNKPFVAQFMGDKVIINWRWKDASRFGIAPNLITDEVKNFRYTVYLLPNKQYKLTMTRMSSVVQGGVNGLSMEKQFFSGKQIGFTKEVDLFGKNKQTGDVGMNTYQFNTKEITSAVVNIMQSMGYQKV